MPHPQGHHKAKIHARLRLSAETLLKEDAPPLHGGGALGVEALTTLYQKATDPETAADALKLLHELQTHQVELDILYDQLMANEYEAREELAYYRMLFDSAPVAYLIVANDGEIIEGNQAVGDLFAQPVSALTGKLVQDFLTTRSSNLLMNLIHGLRQAETSESCQAELKSTGKGSYPLVIKARLSASGDSVQLVLVQDTPFERL